MNCHKDSDILADAECIVIYYIICSSIISLDAEIDRGLMKNKTNMASFIKDGITS